MILETIVFWGLFALSPQVITTNNLHSIIKVGEYTSAADCSKAERENKALLPSGVRIEYVCQEISEVVRPRIEMPWKLIAVAGTNYTHGIVTVLGEYSSIQECNKYLKKKGLYETECINTGK